MSNFKKIFNDEFKSELIANIIWNVSSIVIIFLVVLAFIMNFKISAIPTPSMYPTIKPYDIVIVKRGNKSINRGDIVSFYSPLGDNEEYLKRVIALPEEKIEIAGDEIFINDARIEDSYAAEGTFALISETVPKSSYFVMGDNRYESFDSRDFNSINEDIITGKVIYVIKLSYVVNFFKKI